MTKVEIASIERSIARVLGNNRNCAIPLASFPHGNQPPETLFELLRSISTSFRQKGDTAWKCTADIATRFRRSASRE